MSAEHPAEPTTPGTRTGAAGRWALAAATAMAAGALAGWWIPRGPATTVEAVVGLVAALGVGFLAGVLAVAGYVLYALGQIVDPVEPWQPLSPFYQAVADGPLGAGLPASFSWPMLVSLTVLVAAAPVFGRRDIRTL